MLQGDSQCWLSAIRSAWWQGQQVQSCSHRTRLPVFHFKFPYVFLCLMHSCIDICFCPEYLTFGCFYIVEVCSQALETVFYNVFSIHFANKPMLSELIHDTVSLRSQTNIKIEPKRISNTFSLSKLLRLDLLSRDLFNIYRMHYFFDMKFSYTWYLFCCLFFFPSSAVGWTVQTYMMCLNEMPLNAIQLAVHTVTNDLFHTQQTRNVLKRCDSLTNCNLAWCACIVERKGHICVQRYN